MKTPQTKGSEHRFGPGALKVMAKSLYTLQCISEIKLDEKLEVR